MYEKHKLIEELIDICQLPELTYDLDSAAIEDSQFSEFHRRQTANLPILYDLLQSNEHWTNAAENAEIQKIFASLIMLLSELTAPNAIYKLPNLALLSHAQGLLDKHKPLAEEVVGVIFKNYQIKLQRNAWKRQLGAVHGFLQFLKHLFNNGDFKMSVQQMNFSLAVALNVRECHEPEYKQIGIQLFQIILNHSQTAELLNFNISGVIFDNVIRDVHYMASVAGTDAIWQCLMKCLKHNKPIDSNNWSCVDDLLEILMRDIPLAPNSEISLCMLKYVTKLGYFGADKHEGIKERLEELNDLSSNIPNLIDISKDNNSRIIYRWAKSLLNLFVIEAYKLKQNTDICNCLLEETIRCFTVYIWPLPLATIAPHLSVFYEKYILLLMEVIVAHDKDTKTRQLVKCFVRVAWEKIACAENQCSMLKFKESLQKLEIVLETRKCSD